MPDKEINDVADDEEGHKKKAVSSIGNNPTHHQKDIHTTAMGNSQGINYMTHETMKLVVNLYFDGGSRGNPGIAGSGVLLKLTKIRQEPITYNVHPCREIITHKIRCYCGSNSTNNVAEYNGLLQGLKTLYTLVQDFLKEAVKKQSISPVTKGLHLVEIQVYGDSKLVIDQIKGLMKVKNTTLQVLHASCMDIVRKLQQNHHVEIQFEHIYSYL